MRLTSRQRETLGKVFLNTGNAVLIAWILGSFSGKTFRLSLFIWGVGIYVSMIVLALWIDQ